MNSINQLFSPLISLGVTHEQLQQVFLPIRLYYRLTKWMFGDSYSPFAPEVKNGVHPLIVILLAHQKSIRQFLFLLPWMKRLLQCLITLSIMRWIWHSKADRQRRK